MRVVSAVGGTSRAARRAAGAEQVSRMGEKQARRRRRKSKFWAKSTNAEKGKVNSCIYLESPPLSQKSTDKKFRAQSK